MLNCFSNKTFLTFFRIGIVIFSLSTLFISCPVLCIVTDKGFKFELESIQQALSDANLFTEGGVFSIMQYFFFFNPTQFLLLLEIIISQP